MEETREPKVTNAVIMPNDVAFFREYGEFKGVKTSVETAKLDVALAKAQAKILVAEKSGTNPAFKRQRENGVKLATYSDLSDLVDASREALTSEGIAITQWPYDGASEKRAYLMTRVSFEGQFIMSSLSIPLAKFDGHGVAAGMTYLKRIMYGACLGVVSPSEDDDGNTASGVSHEEGGQDGGRQSKPGGAKQQGGPRGQNGKADQGKPGAAPAPGPGGAPAQREHRDEQQAPKDSPQAGAGTGQQVTDAQIKRLFAMKNAAGWTDDQLRGVMNTAFGIESTKSIHWMDYNRLTKLLEVKVTPDEATERLLAEKAP